VHTDHLRL